MTHSGKDQIEPGTYEGRRAGGVSGGLVGKVALVTGGNRDIGAAVVTRLAAEGADVALTYLRAYDQARDVANGIKAAARGLIIQADSADPAAVVAAVEQTVAEFGRLDILVNNAGVFPTARSRR